MSSPTPGEQQGSGAVLTQRGQLCCNNGSCHQAPCPCCRHGLMPGLQLRACLKIPHLFLPLKRGGTQRKLNSLEMCSACSETFYSQWHCPAFLFLLLPRVPSRDCLLPLVSEEVVITPKRWRDFSRLCWTLQQPSHNTCF